MANTFTQLYVQIVFAVHGRQNLIPKQHREELHKYITGIVQKRKNKMLAVFAMPDHAHLLVGLNPVWSISDLTRDIKAGSSQLITDKNWVRGKFSWQEGYGAFSYSRSQIDKVIRYINKQEQHHKNKSFREEYIEFLEKFEVEYDERYLFEWIE